MGSIVIVDFEESKLNYEFDVAKDGEAFKKDLEKEFKKNGIKRKVTIKKTKDIKPEVKDEKYYYNEDKF